MSRSNNWIRIDKNIMQEFKAIDREYTRLEALVSFTMDIDCNCPWSYAGYAKLWGWSRNKVKKFVTGLTSEKGFELQKGLYKIRRPIHLIESARAHQEEAKHGENEGEKEQKKAVYSGHFMDTSWTHGGHFMDTLGTLDGQLSPSVFGGYSGIMDTSWTHEGHFVDTLGTLGGHMGDTTNKTKTKTNKKPSATVAKTATEKAPGKSGYRTAKGKNLTGVQLKRFLQFWDTFNDKRGKAAAADAWIKCRSYDDKVFPLVINAAKRYAAARPALLQRGNTPKMAEGWISSRRYEDETTAPGASGPASVPDCQSCDYFIRKSCKGGRKGCTAYVISPTKG